MNGADVLFKTRLLKWKISKSLIWLLSESAGNLLQPLQLNISIQVSLTFHHTVWISMLHRKVTSTLMAGLKVSYQDIAQSTTHCLLQVTFYPIMHPGARCFPGKQWTKPRRPHDVKEHVIDQTRPLSSTAHMAIVGAFSGEQGSAWAPWLSAPYTTTAMHCLPEPAWNLMAVVYLLHRTKQDDDHSNP